MPAGLSAYFFNEEEKGGENYDNENKFRWCVNKRGEIQVKECTW